MTKPSNNKNEPLCPLTTPKDTVDEASMELFPERRSTKQNVGFWSKLFVGVDNDIQKCEMQIEKAFKESPLVKLMASALRSAGCPVDMRRHFCCERCAHGVTGGYDPWFNQIVVCYNRCRSYGCTESVVAHELLHMYDACRAHMDFKNPEHIACTEIRAANLFHCSILSGLNAGSVSLTNLKKAHRFCVLQKAVASIRCVKPELGPYEARQIAERVFDRCYNDLEPIGRRVRRGSADRDRAYRERYFYGYD